MCETIKKADARSASSFAYSARLSPRDLSVTPFLHVDIPVFTKHVHSAAPGCSDHTFKDSRSESVARRGRTPVDRICSF